MYLAYKVFEAFPEVCARTHTHTHMLTALTAQGGHTHTALTARSGHTHTHTALTAQGGHTHTALTAHSGHTHTHSTHCSRWTHTHSTHCSTSVVVLCPFLVPQSDLQATFGLLRDRFLLKRKVHPAHCTPHLSPTSPHLPPRHPHLAPPHLTSPPSTPHTSSHSPQLSCPVQRTYNVGVLTRQGIHETGRYLISSR